MAFFLVNLWLCSHNIMTFFPHKPMTLFSKSQSYFCFPQYGPNTLLASSLLITLNLIWKASIHSVCFTDERKKVFIKYLTRVYDFNNTCIKQSYDLSNVHLFIMAGLPIQDRRNGSKNGQEHSFIHKFALLTIYRYKAYCELGHDNLSFLKSESPEKKLRNHCFSGCFPDSSLVDSHWTHNI